MLSKRKFTSSQRMITLAEKKLFYRAATHFSKWAYFIKGISLSVPTYCLEQTYGTYSYFEKGGKYFRNRLISLETLSFHLKKIEVK